MFQKIFSILKKNKMFFLLILAFLVCPMNAKAVQIYYTNKLQFSTLDGGPYYVGDLPTPIYSVKLGGVTSTCIDPAVNSGSGKLYIRGGVVPDTYPNYIERRYTAYAEISSFIEGQAMVWGYRTGMSDYTRVACYLFAQWSETRGGYMTKADCDNTIQSEEWSRSMGYNFRDIVEPKSKNKTYYYWYSVCDVKDIVTSEGKNFDASDLDGSTGYKPIYQRFISSYPGELASETSWDDFFEKHAKEETCITIEGEGSKPKCPEPEVTVAGQCGSVTSYNDPKLSNDWKCIKGVDKYLDSVGNEFCRVYCREDAYTSFPGDNGYVFQAGRYFTVGTSTLSPTWGPITISGTRECRTYKSSSTSAEEGIDYARWLQEYTNTVNAIPGAYDAWQQEKARVYNRTGYREIPNDGRCPIPGTGHYVTRGRGKKQTRRWVCTEGQSCGEGCCVVGYNTWYEFNWHYNGGTNYYGACSPAPGYNSGYESTYNSLVNKRTTLIGQMRECESIQTKLGYDFNPTIEFNYSGDPQYSLSGELESTYSKTETPSIDKIKEASSTVSYVECGNSITYAACNRGNVVPVPPYRNVNVGQNRKTIYVTRNYYLTKNLWQYIDKVTGDMSKTTNGLDQYIDLGAKVLPVSAYRSPGTYPLNLTYYKVGNIVANEAHFDKYAKYSTGTVTNQYACTYQVTNELYGRECGEPGKPKYCDPCTGSSCLNSGKHPVGIDVIYRPISLSNPFPSENGKGRSTGANWCSNGNCANNNDLVKSVITNNRGVKEDAVYNKDPIYSITLTPNIISNIRKYNKSRKSAGSYGDFNLVCDQGTGLNCLSNFIRTSEFSSLFSGSCAKAGRSEFESCRK